MDANFIASLTRSFSPRKKAFVGVSGGRDSVALLHALHAAGFQNLVVCHLNHGLRGRASGEDAKFVRNLSKRLDYACEIKKCEVAPLARKQKLSIETAAREERHRFFAELVRKHRCRRIFLAHHADDQVETVLHQLFRGSGMTGLGGMNPEAEISFDLGSGRPVRLQCVRPLLGIWREDINSYLDEHSLDYREDQSNQDPELSTRNRWRQELIPTLRQALDRDPRLAVFRLSEIAREEDKALRRELEVQWESLIMDNGVRLKLEPLQKLSVAMQRRAIKRWLMENGIPGVGFELVESIRAILPVESAPAAKVNLPGGSHARRRAGALFIDGAD